jgi:hypothetical protein
MEAEILQKSNFTRLQGLCHIECNVFDAIACEFYALSKQGFKAWQNVFEAVPFVWAFGAPQVRHQHDRTTLCQDMLNGGQCSADARVISDFSGFVQGDVEVNANQRAFTFKWEIS